MLICGSSFVMGTSMSILGLAMYSHETGLYSNIEAMVWLPLVCVTIYMLADPIGVGSVPFLYLGEFFPAEMRSILSGITIGKFIFYDSLYEKTKDPISLGVHP